MRLTRLWRLWALDLSNAAVWEASLQLWQFSSTLTDWAERRRFAVSAAEIHTQ